MLSPFLKRMLHFSPDPPEPSRSSHRYFQNCGTRLILNRCLAAVQQHVWRLKQKRVRLTVHQVRSLHMLIPVRPHVDSAWQAKLFRCASFMQAQLCLQSMPRAIRPVLSLMVLNICHAAFCCVVLARHAPKLRCHIPLSISHSRSHSQNNSKSGISHSYPGIS